MSKSERGGVKRNRRGEKRPQHGGREDRGNRSDQPPVDTSSPIIQAFLGHQKDLDTRHDKHERLVKLSRDVTIESKRTIFLLHRISGKESVREDILKEAMEKLMEIEETKWRAIAGELLNEDPYQFLRAYSPGLQEYIEALSFYHYLLSKTLISLPMVEKRLCFTSQAKDELSGETDTHSSQEVEVSSSSKAIVVNPATNPADPPHSPATNPADPPQPPATNPADPPQPPATNPADPPHPPVTQGTGDSLGEGSACDSPATNTSVHIPPKEYILGIADLTGELMRMAINSVGNGNLELPFHLCGFIKDIHDAYVSFGNVSRELPRKLSTLRQSLKKVEIACYTLQVRGSEIPKHMLTDIFASSSAYHERECDNDVSLDD